MARKKRKNSPPVLDSDQAFMDAFSKEATDPSTDENPSRDQQLNRHGVPIIHDIPDAFRESVDDGLEPEMEDEDFESLLDASFKKVRPRAGHPPKPVPLNKRLSRYPAPEIEVDLHGYTALGAEVKARSFVSTCHAQGYFTLRIIVGKGLHSQEGPVLPDVLEDLLNAMKREHLVLAFEWDRKKKARSGALIVYLKRFDNDVAG